MSPLSRFAKADAMRRIDTADYLVVKKPPSGLVWAVQAAAFLIAFMALLQGQLFTSLAFFALGAAVNFYRSKTDNTRRARKRSGRDGDAGGGFVGGCSGGGFGGCGGGGGGCGGCGGG